MKELVLAVILLFSATSDAEQTNKESVDTLFNYACAYTDIFYNVDCKDLDAPTVVTSKVVTSRYYGFYWKGEPYIFISPRIDNRQWNSTVVHETVHYILDHKNAGFTRCESEEAARRTHHSWEKTKYNDKWRVRYGC